MIAIFCLNFVINNILGGFHFKTTKGQHSTVSEPTFFSNGNERWCRKVEEGEAASRVLAGFPLMIIEGIRYPLLRDSEKTYSCVWE